jgi:gas vesicle protein
MADGYDRFENEAGGGGSFVMGLLTGTVLGAGLGMLFAPKSGSELRSQLSEQAGNLANTASEGYRKAAENAGQLAQNGKEVAGEWVERGKDIYDKAREAVTRGADEAQRYVRDAAASGTGAPSQASSGASIGSTGSSASSSSGPSYGSGPNSGSGPSVSGPTGGGSRRS